MSTLNVNVYGILMKLNDGAFIRLKEKFLDNRESFVYSKDHPMAGPLLQVLCDEKIMPVIGKEQFAQIIQAIIPKDILELRWLGKYCDLLVRALGNVQQNTSKDDRASKYANNLINSMIPDFKNNLQSAAKAITFPESLAFIFKISTCLLRCTAHNQYPFEVSVDREIMAELEKRIFKLPGNIFGSYRNEERAYTLLISWIMEEIICDQDGIGEA